MRRRNFIKGAAAGMVAAPSLSFLVAGLPERPGTEGQPIPYCFGKPGADRVHLLVNGHPIKGIQASEVEVARDFSMIRVDLELGRIQPVSFSRILASDEEVDLGFQVAGRFYTCRAVLVGLESFGSPLEPRHSTRLAFLATSPLRARIA